ncbi:MAG: TonB-dependent receptor [Tannerella sp.]|jgi:iron complex outermembrane receptor protein|nr:TonB-dependent receptor [Tannerella sp.]
MKSFLSSLFTIAWLFFSVNAVAQSGGNIAGKVSLSGNEQVQVNISVKGSTNGTITAADGTFVLSGLKQREAYTLIFSSVGYQTVEIKTTGGTTGLHVRMRESLEQLSEVMILGQHYTDYKTDSIPSIGPWNGRILQDVPYSINVIPASLIANNGLSSVDRIFSISPLIQPSVSQSRGYGSYVTLRGLSSNNFTIIDGMPISNATIVPVEDKEQVEILTGLSGFLYGTGHVGGAVDYLFKRPTNSPLMNVTLGNYGGSSYYAHADVGGPIDRNGKTGYRVNALYNDGETSVEFNKVKKWLVSGAFDWNIAKNLLFQAYGSHQYLHETGTETYFAQWQGYTGLDLSTKVFDATKLYGQKWTYNHNEVSLGQAKLTYDIGKLLKIRVAYLYQYVTDDQIYGGPSVLNEIGDYTDGVLCRAPADNTNQSYYFYLDAKARTFSITHHFTVGVNGSRYKLIQPGDRNTLVDFNDEETPWNIYRPTFIDKSDVTIPEYGVKPKYTPTKIGNNNWIIGDDIRFSDKWSALIGLNYSQIKVINRNAAGEITTDYDKYKLTPTASLLFKPVESLTTYLSYIESFEQGRTAGATYSTQPVTNADEVLPPYTSRQYEAGAKVNVGKLLLTAAFFRIDRANQIYEKNDDNTFTYTPNGRQVHKGFEFTSTGYVTDHLMIVGGLTLLDARIRKANAAQSFMEGLKAGGVSGELAKFYAEYHLPFAEQVFLTGGAYYTGEFYSDYNDVTMPSYTTYDLGFRYETHIGKHAATFRLTGANILNKNYWIGYGGAMGRPRTVGFGVSFKL